MSPTVPPSEYRYGSKEERSPNLAGNLPELDPFPMSIMLLPFLLHAGRRTILVARWLADNALNRAAQTHSLEACCHDSGHLRYLGETKGRIWHVRWSL